MAIASAMSLREAGRSLPLPYLAMMPSNSKQVAASAAFMFAKAHSDEHLSTGRHFMERPTAPKRQLASMHRGLSSEPLQLASVGNSHNQSRVRQAIESSRRATKPISTDKRISRTDTSL
jgi:hypothetical protein